MAELPDLLDMPSNPYELDRKHCVTALNRLMKLIGSKDEDVALKAIRYFNSLSVNLLNLATDPRIKRMMEQRESAPAAEEEPSQKKISRLKIVG